MKNMMMLLLCAVSVTATAQDEKTKKHQWHNLKGQQQVMTRGAGMSFQQFDALNKRIAGFPQYKALPGYMVTLSGGSMSTYKNLVSQISIGVGSSLTGNPDKRSSTLRYLGGGIDFGYDLVPSDKVMLYPMAGVGFETYNARFYKDVSNVEFDAAVSSSTIQNSNRSVKFNNSFATYRLGLGLAFKPGKSTGSIGLQAGYVGSFKDRSWRTSENQTLANAPREGLGRFAVSLVFTGGGMMCRK